MATAAGVALAGGTPTRSRDAGGMTAAGRPLSLRVEGVPQRLPNRLLVDLECGTDRPKTHPKPPQPSRLACNPLEPERLVRKHRKLHLHLRNGSNWLQSRPLSKTKQIDSLRNSPCCCSRYVPKTIEKTNNFAAYVRTQMRIAHRHLDRGVPEQLLNRLERRASHREVRREGVPERMPANGAQACALARAPERMLRLVPMKQPALRSRKDELAFQVPVLLERAQALSTKRHFPRGPFFGAPTRPRLTVRFTTNRPVTRSRSSHRRAMISPSHKPHRSAMRIAGLHTDSAAATSRSASSKERKQNFCGGTRSHLTGGICSISSHSCATERSLRSTVR
jgi:hypothetical protein